MSHTHISLTNQYLNAKFSSPFALLAVAIRMARETVLQHHDLPTHGEILNPAYQILQRIAHEPQLNESKDATAPCDSCSKE